MVKNKEGKLVQKFMSKQEIIFYGSSKESKRIFWKSLLAVAALLIFTVVGFAIKNVYMATLGVGFICVFLVIRQIWCESRGRRLWADVSMNEEPVVKFD